MQRYTTPPAPIDILGFVPELAAHGQSIVRLHPHRVKKDLPNHVSKIGGLFLWPSEEPWPMWEGGKFPFVPVMQLRQADVPEMPFPPGTDLFQLLWTPYRDEDLMPNAETKYLPVPKVYWRKAAEVKNPITRFPSLADHGVDESNYDVSDNVPRMCSVHPERVVEFPNFDQLEWQMGEGGKRIAEKIQQADLPIPRDFRKEHASHEPPVLRRIYYGCYLSQCPGLKVAGGEPYADEKGRKWEPFMIIPSWEYDVGTALRWQPLEDREEVSGKKLKDLHHPIGLDLGRTQNVQLWLCRDPAGWVIDMNIIAS